MVKKLFLIPAFLFAVNILLAQDDNLPPPTSKPNPEAEQAPPASNGSDFTGFKKPKKIDWSKFIIEPAFNFAFAPGRIDVGVSPYVGYLLWSPNASNKKSSDEIRSGLYGGAGITYFYTGFSGIQVVDGLGRFLGPAKANYHTYGGGVFLQYNIWRGIFARAKFEVLHRNMSDLNNYPLPKNPNNFADGFYFPRIQATIPDLLVGVGYNLLQSKNFFFPIMVSYNVLNGATNKTYAVYPNAWVVQLGYVTIF